MIIGRTTDLVRLDQALVVGLATFCGAFLAARADDQDTQVTDGDHLDLVEAPAQQLEIDLAGNRPVHLYVGEEWAAIFYDGSGDVVLINEHEMEERGSEYAPLRLNAGLQHGAAVLLEDDLFTVSLKHPDYPANPNARNPIGAQIRDLNGSTLYTAHGCHDLHGEAGNGRQAVFGCTGGALAVEAHDVESGTRWAFRAQRSR